MYQISQASVDDRIFVESEKVRTPPESDRGDTEAVKDTTNHVNVDSKSRGDDMARKLAPLIKHSNRFILDLAPKVRHLHSKFTLGGCTLSGSNPHTTCCYVQRTCFSFTAKDCAAIVGYLGTLK